MPETAVETPAGDPTTDTPPTGRRRHRARRTDVDRARAHTSPGRRTAGGDAPDVADPPRPGRGVDVVGEPGGNPASSHGSGADIGGTPAAPRGSADGPHDIGGTPTAPRELTHREILQVLSGLLLALFVTNVSGTIVSNALPTVSKALQATPQQYTWFVTASLLASTATTPIWGKLADLFSKKKLLLVGLGVFVLGSLACGAAPTTAALIGCRVVQGVGLGAMMALVQAIIGTIIPPRQRGRYMAYTGATMAVATVVGPLVGGFIVDQSWLGWRWCFWSAVPFALAAMAVLQWRLDTPLLRRPGARVDWLGATVVTAAVSLLLIWTSFAGDTTQAGHLFAYASWQSVVMLGGTVLLAVAFVVVELHVPEPIVSMQVLTSRTTGLAVVASIAVGTGMFGASVFLGQYYQIGRGYSPTEAGLMTVPMMAGVLLSSLVIGRLVSRIGRWKPFVVTGSVILAGGFLLLSTIDHATSLWRIGVYMAVAGLGIGMTMQNLVLAVQNTIDRKDVGMASATVTFFRSLGGAFGVQMLGALYAHTVQQTTKDHLTALVRAGAVSPADLKSMSGTMDLSGLPAPVLQAVRTSYADSIGHVFLIAAALSVVSILAVCLMKGTRLRDSWAPVREEIAGHTPADGETRSVEVPADGGARPVDGPAEAEVPPVGAPVGSEDQAIGPHRR